MSDTMEIAKRSCREISSPIDRAAQLTTYLEFRYRDELDGLTGDEQAKILASAIQPYLGKEGLTGLDLDKGFNDILRDLGSDALTLAELS